MGSPSGTPSHCTRYFKVSSRITHESKLVSLDGLTTALDSWRLIDWDSSTFLVGVPACNQPGNRPLLNRYLAILATIVEAKFFSTNGVFAKRKYELSHEFSLDPLFSFM